jgi:hypothetical protein
MPTWIKIFLAILLAAFGLGLATALLEWHLSTAVEAGLALLAGLIVGVFLYRDLKSRTKSN